MKDHLWSSSFIRWQHTKLRARAPDISEVNPLSLLLLLLSKVPPKYSFGNNHSALQLLWLTGHGVEGK
jgi:hypothetical protein